MLPQAAQEIASDQASAVWLVCLRCRQLAFATAEMFRLLPSPASALKARQSQQADRVTPRISLPDAPGCNCCHTLACQRHDQTPVSACLVPELSVTLHAMRPAFIIKAQCRVRKADH